MNIPPPSNIHLDHLNNNATSFESVLLTNHGSSTSFYEYMTLASSMLNVNTLCCCLPGLISYIKGNGNDYDCDYIHVENNNDEFGDSDEESTLMNSRTARNSCLPSDTTMESHTLTTYASTGNTDRHTASDSVVILVNDTDIECARESSETNASTQLQTQLQTQEAGLPVVSQEDKDSETQTCRETPSFASVLTSFFKAKTTKGSVLSVIKSLSTPFESQVTIKGLVSLAHHTKDIPIHPLLPQLRQLLDTYIAQGLVQADAVDMVWAVVGKLVGIQCKGNGLIVLAFNFDDQVKNPKAPSNSLSKVATTKAVDYWAFPRNTDLSQLDKAFLVQGDAYNITIKDRVALKFDTESLNSIRSGDITVKKGPLTLPLNLATELVADNTDMYEKDLFQRYILKMDFATRKPIVENGSYVLKSSHFWLALTVLGQTIKFALPDFPIGESL